MQKFGTCVLLKIGINILIQGLIVPSWGRRLRKALIFNHNNSKKNILLFGIQHRREDRMIDCAAGGVGIKNT